jgi:hypothetical protein
MLYGNHWSSIAWLVKNPGQFQKVFLFDLTGSGKIEEIL